MVSLNLHTVAAGFSQHPIQSGLGTIIFQGSLEKPSKMKRMAVRLTFCSATR